MSSTHRIFALTSRVRARAIGVTFACVSVSALSAYGAVGHHLRSPRSAVISGRVVFAAPGHKLRRVSAIVEVWSEKSRQDAARISSARRLGFSVAVVPGRYTLTASGNSEGPPECLSMSFGKSIIAQSGKTIYVRLEMGCLSNSPGADHRQRLWGLLRASTTPRALRLP